MQQCKERIRQAFRKYGIERTEDKIREMYKNHPETMKHMLKCYKEILEEK